MLFGDHADDVFRPWDATGRVPPSAIAACLRHTRWITSKTMSSSRTTVKLRLAMSPNVTLDCCDSFGDCAEALY